MNIDAYLSRLNYTAPVSPSYETLSALQAAHMRAVPFENLDIVPLHRAIHLDEASLWEKIVERRRGGFCYELNGQFAWLLRQIGFEITYLNGRVFRRTGELGIEFDHLVLLARVPGEATPWLTDAGFGDSFMEPLALREGEHAEGLRAYRLEATGNGWIVWQRDYDGKWERSYFFDEIPRNFPADYKAGCTYHQRSPQSSFTRNGVISIATLNGRITLEKDRLIVTENGRRRENPVSPEEWPELLKKHFGVVL